MNAHAHNHDVPVEPHLTPFDRLSLVMPWVSRSSQAELRQVREAMAALVDAARKQQAGEFKCMCSDCRRLRDALAVFEAPAVLVQPVNQRDED